MSDNFFAMLQSLTVIPPEWSWLHVILAITSAVLVPLILHRIFFYRKKVRHGSSAGSGSLEEYMTQHGMNELDAKFQVAVDFIAAYGGNKLSNEQRLTLYAFYKQAHFGPCSIEKPSAADLIGSAKWESWNALGDMDQDVAKQQYLEWVQDLFEDFDVRGKRNRRSSSSGSEKQSVVKSSISTASAVSMPTVDMSTEEWKVKEDVFHFASIGDAEKVTKALESGFDINAQDDEGRTMLHWAVDREQSDIVRVLLSNKASPNVQDTDGMTPLHYAASCEHLELAKLLLDHGASPDIEDNDGDTPSEEVLQAIRSS